MMYVMVVSIMYTHVVIPSLLWSTCSNDVLREDRVTGDPIEADKSNFLHPVVYYYRQPPGKKSMSCFPGSLIPRPLLFSMLHSPGISMH